MMSAKPTTNDGVTTQLLLIDYTNACKLDIFMNLCRLDYVGNIRVDKCLNVQEVCR